MFWHTRALLLLRCVGHSPPVEERDEASGGRAATNTSARTTLLKFRSRAKGHAVTSWLMSEMGR